MNTNTARTQPRRIPLTKALSTIIGLPLFGVLLLWLPAWAFTLLMGSLAALAGHEFGRLFLAQQHTDRWLLAGSAALLTLAAGLLPPALLLPLVAVVAMLVLSSALLRPAAPPTALPLLLLGVFYTGVLTSFLPLVRLLPTAEWGILWLFLAAWGGDLGAGLVGILLGRHHLPARINARKTWEGIIGGTLLSLSFTLSLAPAGIAGSVIGAGVGLLIALAAQAGDLFESLLKRSVGADDSGMLVPGQGGVLDRLDSVLFVAPLVYLSLLLLGGH